MAIDLKEVMNIIRSEKWFSIRFITADLLKGKGGQVMEFAKCRIARKQTLTESGISTISTTGHNKNANHNFHFTVNLELVNKQIRKVHPVLITHLNGEKVL